MENAVKNLLKKTPPMKWLLGRINKLEKTAKEDRNSVNRLKALNEECMGKLKKLEDEILRHNNRVRQLEYQNSKLKEEIEYWYFRGLPAEQYVENLKEWYKSYTGETLDLEHPETYNEKIQWMKLYDSTPLKTKLADKYLVRGWVAEKIGEEYLVHLLGVYDKFDDIDFEKLPNKFVIKTNHGSGWNIVVRDKAKFNQEEAKKKIDSWLSKNFAFVCGLELHYLNITPKIIIEEYIENNDNNLDDYKFMCFNGEVKFIWVVSDRSTSRKRTLFTTNWERMDQMISHYPPANYEIPKPKTFDKMLEFATLLSKDFAHVRVDFYEVKGKLYFGELTFTSESGIACVKPREFGVEMGGWIKLPEKSDMPRLK